MSSTDVPYDLSPFFFSPQPASNTDTARQTYCKYVKFLNTVTSKMCDEAGSVTDKCASFSDSEQYAAFTARLTDARSAANLASIFLY